MIPKTIHYCWFGRNGMPPLVHKCIKSWKEHLPNYEFKLWNEDTFDISNSEWCKGAYENKKYAFVADYVRLIVLYENGGVYLDTDEKMEKSINPFVEKDAAFMGFEDGKVLSMGVMGFPPKHHLIAEFLEYYNQPFSIDIIQENLSNAVIATNYLVNKYGLKPDNSEQMIGNIHIYPSTFFNAMDFFGNWDRSPNTTTVHLYMGSWLPESEQRKLQFRKTFLFKISKSIWDSYKQIKILRYIRQYFERKNII